MHNVRITLKHALVMVMLVLVASVWMPTTAWGTGGTIPVSPPMPSRPVPLNPGDATRFIAIPDLQNFADGFDGEQARFFAGVVNGGRTYEEYDSVVSSTLSIMKQMEEGKQYSLIFQQFPPATSQEGYLMYLLLQNYEHGKETFNAFEVVNGLLKSGNYDDAYYLSYYVMNASDAWRTANSAQFAQTIVAMSNELKTLGVTDIVIKTDELSLVPVVFDDLLAKHRVGATYSRGTLTQLRIGNQEGSVIRMSLLMDTSPRYYNRMLLHEWTHACTSPACYLPGRTNPQYPGAWYKELVADRVEWRVSKNMGWVSGYERPINYAGSGYAAINATHTRLLREQIMRELGSSYSSEAFEALYIAKEQEMLKLILAGQATEQDLSRIYGRTFDMVNAEFNQAMRPNKAVSGVMASASDDVLTLVGQTRTTSVAGTTGAAAEVFVDEVVETVPKAARIKDVMRPLWRGSVKFLAIAGRTLDVLTWADMFGALAMNNWDVMAFITPVIDTFLPSGNRHKTGDIELIPLQEGNPVLMPDMLLSPAAGLDITDLIAGPVQTETYALSGHEITSSNGELYTFEHYFGGSGSLQVKTNRFSMGYSSQVCDASLTTNCLYRDPIRITTFVPNKAVYTNDYNNDGIDDYAPGSGSTSPVPLPAPVPGFNNFSDLDPLPVGELYTWELKAIGMRREDLFGNATDLPLIFDSFIMPIIESMFTSIIGQAGATEDTYSVPVAKFEVVSAQSMTKKQYDDWVQSLDKETGALGQNEWQSSATGHTSTATPTFGAPLTPPLSIALPSPNPTPSLTPTPTPQPGGLAPFVGSVFAAEAEMQPREFQIFSNGVMGRTGTDEFAPVAATQFPLEEPVPETEPPSPDCLYFSLGQTMFDGVTGTGHFLCDTAPDGTIVDFRKYYEEHSGSTSLGAPLDEMVMKDGVWVQHFETNELRCDERLSHPDDRLCGTAMASGGQSLLLDIAYRGEIKDARYGVLIGELKAAEPEVSTNWLGMKTADAQSPGVTAEQWLNPFSRVTASGTSGTYYAYFDENGHFALVAPVDTYSISISIAGHKTLKLPWEVRKGNTDVAFYTPEVGGRLEIGGELMIIPFGDMESKATLGLGALGILLIPFAAGAVLLGGVGILGARFLSKRSL